MDGWVGGWWGGWRRVLEFGGDADEGMGMAADGVGSG